MYRRPSPACVLPSSQSSVKSGSPLPQSDVDGDSLSIAFSTPTCLEAMQKGVNKGNAVKAVLGLMGRDLAEAIEFYDKGLGFPRMESPPEVAFFTLNGTWLGLYGREALAEDATVSSKGEGFEAFTLAHNVDSQGAVDRLLADAVAAGARLVQPAGKVFWGGYRGYFADPDGFLWEICWNPFFPLDAQGRVQLPA